MDNLDNDNFGVEDVTKIFEGAKNIVQSVKNKKKAKEAQDWSDKNDYWFLSPAAKKLIPIPNYVVNAVQGQGITQEAILNYPKQPHNTTFDDVKAGLQLASGYVNPTATVTQKSVDDAGTTDLNAAGEKMRKYLPYLLGAVVLGVLVYFIAKK